MKDFRSRTQVSPKKQCCLSIEGLVHTHMFSPSLSGALPSGDDGVLVLRWLQYEHLAFIVTLHSRELSYLEVYNHLHKETGGSEDGE